jgi:flagellar hook-associated protein 1 FlgK
MSSIIPTYQSQLNGIAQQLADQVNAVHEKGYDLNGDPGTAMFDDGSGVTTGITAANISLAITDPRKVAAAVLSPTDTGGPISADHDIATKLYQLRLGLPQADGSYADGADSIYRKMIVSLGVQSSSTANNLTTANVISTNVDASRESVSGVNLDEEMSNMLQFQHGYAAAGKVVATIQTMMDTLINMVQG